MNKSRAPRCISRFWGHEPFAITVEPGLRVGSLLALTPWTTSAGCGGASAVVRGPSSSKKFRRGRDLG
jgi:hypothetical protein